VWGRPEFLPEQERPDSRSLGLRRTSNMGLVAILSLRPRRLFLYTALVLLFPLFGWLLPTIVFV